MQNISISENNTLSSTSATISITELTPMKPQNSQTKEERKKRRRKERKERKKEERRRKKEDSASQNVSGTTITRPNESMPNLTVAALTTDGDTAAILQEPTAVTVIEPITLGPTPIKLENNAGLRNHELSNINTSENEILSSSPAVPTTDEPTSMTPENGKLETISTSQNVSATTIKRLYGSLPNLTSTGLTTADNEIDTAAILQEPTAVNVQPVSIEPIAFGPTPIKLENNADLRNHELSNINTSENEILSSSPAVPTTDEPTSMTPEKGQLETISTSQNVSATTIKRLYGSLPNLTSTALTTAGNEIDTAAILQEPTAVNVQSVSIEPIPIGPTPIKLENNAGLRNQELPTAEVSSDQSATVSYRDGSGEPDLKSRDLAGLQKELWHSMPNIGLHYTDKTSYDTKIECTASMKVSHDSSTRSSMTVTEPEVTQVKLKRRSLWKRAKKFARRVFCCAA